MSGTTTPYSDHKRADARRRDGDRSSVARTVWWALAASAVTALTAGVAILRDSPEIGLALTFAVVAQLVPLGLLLLDERLRRRSAAAGRDYLTGLLTAETWYRRAGSELAQIRSDGSNCGLLVIDIDRLGRINSEHGWAAGNEVLRRVADLVRAEAGRRGIAGRLAGDEFVLLVASVGGIELIQLAERIRAQVRTLSVGALLSNSYFTIVDDISVSVGAVVYPRNGRELNDLLLTADMLLLAAQRDGYDQVRSLGPDLCDPLV